MKVIKLSCGKQFDEYTLASNPDITAVVDKLKSVYDIAQRSDLTLDALFCAFRVAMADFRTKPQARLLGFCHYFISELYRVDNDIEDVIYDLVHKFTDLYTEDPNHDSHQLYRELEGLVFRNIRIRIERVIIDYVMGAIEAMDRNQHPLEDGGIKMCDIGKTKAKED